MSPSPPAIVTDQQEAVLYHSIVRAVVRKAFGELNRGNLAPVLAAFHPRARHFFIGAHCLAGTRNTPGSRARWYHRLHALFPEFVFTIHSIRVSGTPWNTCVRVVWTENNVGTDGVSASNDGMNVFTMAWGRVTDLSIYTDTHRLVAALDRLARSGNTEAAAAPIQDP